MAILKEGEAGVAVAQITRKHGMSAAIYYHWKSKYGGAAVSGGCRNGNDNRCWWSRG